MLLRTNRSHADKIVDAKNAPDNARLPETNPAIPIVPHPRPITNVTNATKSPAANDADTAPPPAAPATRGRKSTGQSTQPTHSQVRRRKTKSKGPPLHKTERWLTLITRNGNKDVQPSGKHLLDALQRCLREGRFSALPYICYSEQLKLTTRHSQWIVQLPHQHNPLSQKSCGSLTLYSARWDVAATKGNLMINANPLITRSVRTKLLTTCSEVTNHLCCTNSTTHAKTAPPPTTAPAPTCLTQALDQAVACLDPHMATILLAMNPNTTPPGEPATAMPQHLNNLLQRKTNSQSSKNASASSR